MEESGSTKLSRHEKDWKEMRELSVNILDEADRYVPLRCPACGKFVRHGDLFCPHCFHELKDNCPHCGEIIRSARGWCPHCHRLLSDNQS